MTCYHSPSRARAKRKRDSADFAEAILRGKAKSCATISNVLYEKARGGDLGAIVWWEKTRRGLSDRSETTHHINTVKVEPYHYDSAVAALKPPEDNDQ